MGSGQTPPCGYLAKLLKFNFDIELLSVSVRAQFYSQMFHDVSSLITLITASPLSDAEAGLIRRIRELGLEVPPGAGPTQLRAILEVGRREMQHVHPKPGFGAAMQIQPVQHL